MVDTQVSEACALTAWGFESPLGHQLDVVRRVVLLIPVTFKPWKWPLANQILAVKTEAQRWHASKEKP